MKATPLTCCELPLNFCPHWGQSQALCLCGILSNFGLSTSFCFKGATLCILISQIDYMRQTWHSASVEWNWFIHGTSVKKVNKVYLILIAIYIHSIKWNILLNSYIGHIQSPAGSYNLRVPSCHQQALFSHISTFQLEKALVKCYIWRFLSIWEGLRHWDPGPDLSRAVEPPFDCREHTPMCGQ